MADNGDIIQASSIVEKIEKVLMVLNLQAQLAEQNLQELHKKYLLKLETELK